MQATDNILIVPSALRHAVEAAAAEEDRPPGELLREAIERYLEARRWRRLYAYGEERARTLGLGEDDIPRLIAETRAARRREPPGA